MGRNARIETTPEAWIDPEWRRKQGRKPTDRRRLAAADAEAETRPTIEIEEQIRNSAIDQALDAEHDLQEAIRRDR